MPQIAIVTYMLRTARDLEDTKREMTGMLDRKWTVLIAMPKSRDTLLVIWQK